MIIIHKWLRAFPARSGHNHWRVKSSSAQKPEELPFRRGYKSMVPRSVGLMGFVQSHLDLKPWSFRCLGSLRSQGFQGFQEIVATKSQRMGTPDFPADPHSAAGVPWVPFGTSMSIPVGGSGCLNDTTGPEGFIWKGVQFRWFSEIFAMFHRKYAVVQGSSPHFQTHPGFPFTSEFQVEMPWQLWAWAASLTSFPPRASRCWVRPTAVWLRHLARVLCSLSEENDDKPYGGFLKLGYPQIIHFSRIFHCKPSSNWGTSIYGNPHMDLDFGVCKFQRKQ